jgi:hypothetical protein
MTDIIDNVTPLRPSPKRGRGPPVTRSSNGVTGNARPFPFHETLPAALPFPG